MDEWRILPHLIPIHEHTEVEQMEGTLECLDEYSELLVLLFEGFGNDAITNKP